MAKPLIYNTVSEGQGLAKMGYLELENQQGCEPFEGSNPSLSAIQSNNRLLPVFSCLYESNRYFQCTTNKITLIIILEGHCTLIWDIG